MLNYDKLATMSDDEFDALLASISTQQAAPITLPTPKLQPTGLVKGALKSLGRGVGGAISQVGKALEYDQNQQPDLVNKAGYYIDEFGNKVSNLIEAPVAEQGSQREKFFQAMESVPTSLAMSAPAIVGGALAGRVGAIVGGLASYPIMQQAAAQEVTEQLKAQRPDLSDSQIREMATKSGLWEAGPEAATNIAEGLLFRTTPLGRGVLPFIKALGKNIAKSTPLEMAGEAVTGYGQAKTLQPAFPEIDPLKEAIGGANVAAYMAPFMAGGGTIINKLAQPKEEAAPIVEDSKTETDLIAPKEPFKLTGQETEKQLELKLKGVKKRKVAPLTEEAATGDESPERQLSLGLFPEEFTEQGIHRSTPSGRVVGGEAPVITPTESTNLLETGVKGLDLRLRNPSYVKQLSEQEIVDLVINPQFEQLLSPKAIENVRKEVTVRQQYVEDSRQGSLFPPQAPTQAPIVPAVSLTLSGEPIVEAPVPEQGEFDFAYPEAQPSLDFTQGVPTDEQTVTRGFSGQEQKRQEPGQAGPEQATGQEEIVPSGAVQAYEGGGQKGITSEVAPPQVPVVETKKLPPVKAPATAYDDDVALKPLPEETFNAKPTSVQEISKAKSGLSTIINTSKVSAGNMGFSSNKQEFFKEVAFAAEEIQEAWDGAAIDDTQAVALFKELSEFKDKKAPKLGKEVEKFNWKSKVGLDFGDDLEYKAPYGQTIAKTPEREVTALDFGKEVANNLSGSQRTLLNSLLNTPGLKKISVSIVNQIHPTDATKYEKALGIYARDRHAIKILNIENEDVRNRAFLHELAHAAVTNTIDRVRISHASVTVREREAVDRLNKLYSQALSNKDRDRYGLKNVDEFVAEAMTNPDFQKFLANIPVPKELTLWDKVASVWDAFTSIIRKMLKIDSKDANVLTEVLETFPEVAKGKTYYLPSVSGNLESQVYEDRVEALSQSLFGVKSKITRDYITNTQYSTSKKIKGLLGAVAPNVPVFELVKGFVRNPFFQAEKVEQVSPEAGKQMAAAVKANENRTEHRNLLLNRFGSGSKDGKIKGFEDIVNMADALTPEQHNEFERLTVFGDFKKTEYEKLTDLPKDSYLGTISKEAFAVYSELRKFAKKVYLDIQDELLNTVLLKYNTQVRKKLREVIQDSIDNTAVTEEQLKARVSEILTSTIKEDKNTVREAVRDVLEAKKHVDQIRNEINQWKGYMPRLRKPGEYKLTVRVEGAPKGEDRIFMQMYPTKMARDLAKKAILDDPKGILGINYKKGQKYNFDYSYVPQNSLEGITARDIASDVIVDEAIRRAFERGDLNDEEISNLRNILTQGVTKVLLGESASKHKLQRLEDYIAGFDTDPLKSFQSMINSMAFSMARTRYVQEEMQIYQQTKDIDPEAADWILKYIKTTLQARTIYDNASAKARYLTTVYFMGLNIGAGIINMTQNLVLGAPELSRYTSFTDATKLLTKYMYEVTPQNVSHQIRRRGIEIAPVSDKLPKQLQEALAKYRMSGLNFDTQTTLAMGANEEMMGGTLWENFRKVADMAMIPFKAVETANREAALLAAFDVFSKNDRIDLNKEMSEEQFKSLYDRAVKFVDTVHFMGAGNLPINVQKSALARTILAMQSYGINFFNYLYNRLSSSDKAQFQAGMKVLGMMFLLGGAMGGIPAADDLNKILKKLLGRDLKLEATKALGEMTHEDFAQFMMHGVPTIFGGNISNNVNLRIPFFSSLLGATDLGVASAGAFGSMAMRQYQALNYLSDGQFGKAIGIGSPEAIGRVFRAYAEYEEGFTSKKGAPVYFEGKKLKTEPEQALLKALTGFRTERETKIADVRFSKFELQQQWQDKRSVAINKFAAGDRQAMLDFNDALRDNDQARLLVKPITGADKIKAMRRKEPKKDIRFESEYA